MSTQGRPKGEFVPRREGRRDIPRSTRDDATTCTLSSLLQCTVVREDGTSLGRIYDCRCRGGPGGRRTRAGAQVTALVYGMPGWLERLGVRSARTHEIAWRDVLRIEGERIVVRMPRR